ncbi:hypothetical protein H5410_022072 [Solanum commersonii]|uniref:Uncharacterized protein n=1 Tax=Solanum commersonii TaxID=4109 RepID=A0A9J5ZFQ2_SOLCO|nr:hypothetical protein H5410_022072 [Solanum commersonii]
MLSLFPPFLEDIVIDADPISYCLSHQSSSSTTVNFPFCMFHQVSPPSSTTSSCTIVDFSSIDGSKDDPYSPFLTLFTQVSENTSNPNSCVFASSSRELNASGNCAPKRQLLQELGEEKFAPFKKIKLRNESNGEEGQWITKRLTRSDVMELRDYYYLNKT